MKRTLVVVGCVIASLAVAQDTSFGTKSDPLGSAIPSGGAAVSPMPLIQMFIALAIVLGLVKWLLPKLLGKVNKKLTTGIGSAIRIEESAQFAGGTLYVVNAKSKTLLLSVTSQGVQCLSDLTEPPKPEPATFEELVEQSPAVPDFVFTAQGRPEPSQTQIEAALARLSILAN